MLSNLLEGLKQKKVEEIGLVKRHWVSFLLSVLIIGIIIGEYILYNYNHSPSPTEQPSVMNRGSVKINSILPLVEEKSAKTSGRFYLTKDDGGYVLMADSNEKSIIGFDVIFKGGEKNSFQIENSSNQFDIYSFKKEGYTTVTGIKKIEIKTDVVLKDEVMMRITLDHIYDLVTIVPSVGKETTKMIDSSLEKIYPALK